MTRIQLVTVRQDEAVQVHLPGFGEYATLCGLDGEDEEIGQETVATARGAVVDCPDCTRIWAFCRQVPGRMVKVPE